MFFSNCARHALNLPYIACISAGDGFCGPGDDERLRWRQRYLGIGVGSFCRMTRELPEIGQRDCRPKHAADTRYDRPVRLACAAVLVATTSTTLASCVVFDATPRGATVLCAAPADCPSAQDCDVVHHVCT